jgi:hypothetical protein
MIYFSLILIMDEKIKIKSISSKASQTKTILNQSSLPFHLIIHAIIT